MGNPITERAPGVRVIASSSTWMEGETLHQLDAASRLAGMEQVVAMPDAQPGKGGPSGAAFLSREYVHPILVGNDIGCGMGLWSTSLPLRRARPLRMAEAMEGLDAPWDTDITALVEDLGLEPGVHDVAMGTIGSGNHFLELQAVHEVVDQAALARLGVDPAMVQVLVHTGSRGLGEHVMRTHSGVHGANPAHQDSAEGVAYLAAHDGAMLWARANRANCALRAMQALGLEGQPVLDSAHNALSAVDIGGRPGWLHRKGAAPADCGAVVIPGSRDDLSVLVEPLVGSDLALRSLAHGAGRKIARASARAKLQGVHGKQGQTTSRWGGIVVCGNELVAWEEAAGCYKPLDSVVGDLVDAGLVRVLAYLRPLVTYKSSAGVVTARKQGLREWKRIRTQQRDAKDRRLGR